MQRAQQNDSTKRKRGGLRATALLCVHRNIERLCKVQRPTRLHDRGAGDECGQSAPCRRWKRDDVAAAAIIRDWLERGYSERLALGREECEDSF
jgi:hypothetical protein